MRFTHLIVLALISICCSNETHKEQVVNSYELTVKASEVKEITKEIFSTFFDKFSVDSAFQFSRIKFPISYYVYDIEDNKDEYVYNKDEFWYTDFTQDSSANKRKTDAYRPVIKQECDSKTTYIRKGIDNGIRIEYYFELDAKGEWYMVKIVDNSV